MGFIALGERLWGLTHAPFNVGMDIRLLVRLVMMILMTELDA